MIFNKKFWQQAALAMALVMGMSPVSGVAQAQQRAHSANARGGEVSRGYLGVGVLELTDDRVKALHLKDDHGVEVNQIVENSPAAKAGIKPNDVILEVNGRPIEDRQEFQISIAETAPGTKVSLTLWRNGARQSVSATLDTLPPNFMLLMPPDAPMPPMPEVPFNGGNQFPGIPANSPIVGFLGEELTGQLADYFGVKHGVLVHSVNQNTPAERAGLKAGDVVVKVNGTPVMSPHEITGLVSASRKKAFSFTVVRNKKEMTLSVEIAEGHPEPSDRIAL
jgi:serine protease Do